MNATQLQTHDGESTTVEPVLNIAAYKFVRLHDLEALRTELRQFCWTLGLRGTILLSSEGINLFIAGESESVEKLLARLRKLSGLEDLEAKRSYSAKVPFRRMLVRLKKEIIPCGIESIQPDQQTSPKLSAKELKRWLDEGRPVRMLDVRNNYEVELGTFQGAEQLGLGHFRDFPAAIGRLPEKVKSEPIVMFCTGGIRCEKAGPVMEQAGFREVYQLDGGILKYFEECGGSHYDGSCFVFDGRVALDPELKPTGNLLCFSCQAVLTADDVTSGKFLFGEYCPQCYQEPEERVRSQFEQRQALIYDLAAKQSGSEPYDNVREIHVPGKFAGMTLIDFLDAWQPAVGRDQWLAWLEAEQISNPQICQPDQIVREGERFVQHMPDTVEPKINPQIELLHEDESLVVVNKPAPLPCHPSGRFNRNTLSVILNGAYPNEKLRVAHRLDANTTGVVVLCRKYRSARLVQPQFSNQKVGKVYVVRVVGHPDWNSLRCDAGISSQPVTGVGHRIVDEQGQPALTEFSVIKRLADNSTLIEARPVTGRTNQIRVHLWHLGLPVMGDPLYLADGAIGSVQTLSLDSEPMCLHAKSVTLVHPDLAESVTYEAPLPWWAEV